VVRNRAAVIFGSDSIVITAREKMAIEEVLKLLAVELSFDYRSDRRAVGVSKFGAPGVGLSH
jgi:hypothetical protein